MTQFLPPDATTAQQIRAAADNHTEWFAADGGTAHRENGATWINKAPEEIILAFPEMTPETAGETLDKIISEGRKHQVKTIACWSLSPTKPRDLGARLAARGFEWGWRPHWMSLDLDALGADFDMPGGLQIAVDNDADWDVDDLPYFTRKTAGEPTLSKPSTAYHFGAQLDGQMVGHSVMFLTTGRRGVAGIYSVGVVPSARRRGIGRAVTLAACRMARELGAHHALLNAAAPELYTQCGFVSLGFGQTWWMHAPTLAAPRPSASEIAFAEAVGRGDVTALDALPERPADLDAPLPGGYSPLALAMTARKLASVRWLLRHGATLRADSSGFTPLHEAASSGDVPILRLLLSTRPDRKTLERRETQFGGTPLDWARHFGHDKCAATLEEYRGSLG